MGAYHPDLRSSTPLVVNCISAWWCSPGIDDCRDTPGTGYPWGTLRFRGPKAAESGPRFVRLCARSSIFLLGSTITSPSSATAFGHRLPTLPTVRTLAAVLLPTPTTKLCVTPFIAAIVAAVHHLCIPYCVLTSTANYLELSCPQRATVSLFKNIFVIFY